MNSSSESMVVGGGVFSAGFEELLLTPVPERDCFFLDTEASESPTDFLLRVWGGVVDLWMNLCLVSHVRPNTSSRPRRWSAARVTRSGGYPRTFRTERHVRQWLQNVRSLWKAESFACQAAERGMTAPQKPAYPASGSATLSHPFRFNP